MRMKSGVQLNFLERRALAERALSRLVRIAREDTAAMSSREQRGIYQLEAMLADGSSEMRPDRGWIDPTLLARAEELWSVAIASVRQLWRQKLPRYWQAILAHRSGVLRRLGPRSGAPRTDAPDAGGPRAAD
jgi:hypothetical protein